MTMLGGMALSAAMFDAFSVAVEYRRGGAAIASGIKAKLGSTLFRADDNRGMTIRTEQRDFIVKASDFAAGFEPETGDEIAYDGHRYLVTAPNGEPCWRWHSRLNHSQIRVHAKHVGTDN